MAHLAKALAKIASWAGYFPRAAADRVGKQTFQLIATGELDRPAALVDLSLVGWLALVATAWIVWRGWQWAKRAAPDSLLAARAGLVTAALLFSSALAVWCLS